MELIIEVHNRQVALRNGHKFDDELAHVDSIYKVNESTIRINLKCRYNYIDISEYNTGRDLGLRLSKEDDDIIYEKDITITLPDDFYHHDVYTVPLKYQYAIFIIKNLFDYHAYESEIIWKETLYEYVFPEEAKEKIKNNEK